jgi:alpha-glucosidase
MSHYPWWRGAVIYQIYPRSFLDANGDGVGDLPGIIQRLDHIATLGVDAIWISPFFKSPMADFGYDIADYRDVDPLFGSLDDFDRLLAKAHDLGLKVMIDQVLSHTSIEHAWFRESRQDRGNPKADWYVWADPREDGTPPNNWLSVFGGPAWSYHPLRRQYYFHKFLKQQPKINLYNREARKAAIDVLRFWLDRGVDGFRLDVANSYLHDAELRDNPSVPMAERTAHHWAHAPNLQRRIRDSNLPENREVLDEIRAAVDAYDNRFVFGEFSEEPGLLGHFAGRDHGLHTGYTFTFLEDRSFKPRVFAEHYKFLNAIDGLWPCVTMSNHDVPRAVTRYGRTMEANPELARLALTLMMALKGTVLMYQGEELGLPDGPIEREQIRDPVGELYFPYSMGRDPCRTPMPWVAGKPNLGFSYGEPWLPMAPSHKSLTAALQEHDQSSTLWFTRRLIELRKANPVLRFGDIRITEASDQILAFEREWQGTPMLCVFNLSAAPAVFTMSSTTALEPVLEVGHCDREPGRIGLGPRSALIARKA